MAASWNRPPKACAASAYGVAIPSHAWARPRRAVPRDLYSATTKANESFRNSTRVTEWLAACLKSLNPGRSGELDWVRHESVMRLLATKQIQPAFEPRGEVE